MINRLFKKNSDSEVINYSTKGVCFNPAINLQKHYTEYFEAYHDEAVFFEELFEYLDPIYDELNSEKWNFPENLLAQFINNEKVITTFKSIEDYRLSEFHNRLVSTFKEINNKKIRNLISNSDLNVTSDDLREGIKTQFFECFNNTILNISRHLEIVLNHDIFSVGNCKRILLDLTDETIKPERYSSNSFSINHGSTGNFLDPIYEIAIKHTTFALDDLSVDDKIVLIPTLEKHLHNEQNYKIAKRHKYKGIDGLEEFYQLYLDRYKQIKNENSLEDLPTECYFMVGKGRDTEKHRNHKKQQLRNFLKSIKHKFADKPSIEQLESLYSQDVGYVERFDWLGGYKEFNQIIAFLTYKNILGSKNINKVILSRILFEGQELTKTSGTMSSERSQITMDKKSDWYKEYSYFLDLNQT